MPRLDVDRFLEDVTGRYARTYAEALGDLLLGLATGSRTLAAQGRNDLAAVVQETMGVGEVLGASLVLQESADAAAQAEQFCGGRHVAWWAALNGPQLRTFADTATQDILPRVTLAEAVEDMVSRVPTTLKRAADRTAQNIAKLYGEGRVVAFARAAEHSVTRRVQELMAQAIREGITETEAGRTIVASVDEVRKRTAAWTEDYARMAFRTNLNTAVTAGRFRQVQDPDIRAVIPAGRFDAVGDADTRDNHMAADGIIMRVDNAEWRRIAPPLGYRCRCQFALVSIVELERLGRVGPSGRIIEDSVPFDAGPDPGFRHGGRPDLLVNQLAT